MSDKVYELARRLHRRHCIDMVEMERMASAALETGDKCGDIGSRYDRWQHELDEGDVDSKWDSSGSHRNYWMILAREAIGFVENKQPSAMPKVLRCRQCGGRGYYLKSKFADHFSICECGAPVTLEKCVSHMPVLDDGWHKTNQSK